MLTSRCPNKRLTALASAVVPGARRSKRDRISPTAGPPKTRTISAVLPPSSVTGRTCHTFVPPSLMALILFLLSLSAILALSFDISLISSSQLPPGEGTIVSNVLSQLSNLHKSLFPSKSPDLPLSLTTFEPTLREAISAAAALNAVPPLNTTMPGLPLLGFKCSLFCCSGRLTSSLLIAKWVSPSVSSSLIAAVFSSFILVSLVELELSGTTISGADAACR
mmetsp:Transcript_18698/g.38420  ORF Transcript_18698/g.38420 Transcript_18698/m.38420 type:complete len:222 (+) Transcript_18698:1601-2266(+)